MKTFFITGTGTGIGKTFFTGLMARLAVSCGLKTAVMKPVQTGVTKLEDGDIGEIRKLAPGIIQLPDKLACPYLFKFEASPHLAAEAEGVEIKVERIQKAVEKIKKNFAPDILLLEGAGGVCVPLQGELLNSDLIAKIECPAIVVALAGLGTINHSILTINDLRAKSIPLAGVAINQMSEKPGPIELDNLKMIERIGRVKILSVTKNSPDLSGSGFDSCDGLLELLNA